MCEPSLERLAVIAEHNGGVCHLEKGFTLRRLAYGSVFWPGPFDLSNIDLDEVSALYSFFFLIFELFSCFLVSVRFHCVLRMPCFNALCFDIWRMRDNEVSRIEVRN